LLPKDLKLFFCDDNGNVSIQELQTNIANFFQNQGCNVIDFIWDFKAPLYKLLFNVRISQIIQLINQFSM